MKVTISQLVPLFAALGFDKASRWPVEKAQTKLDRLYKVINDPKAVDASAVAGDAEAKKLWDKIAKAATAKETITVIVEDEKSDEPAEKPAKAAKADKPAKKAAKPAKEEEADDEEAPDAEAADEAPDADETPEASDADADDESDDDDEDEKPAKKAKSKPAKSKPAARESSGKKDKYGYREGTRVSKVALALSKKPQSMSEIGAAAKVSGTSYEALARICEDNVGVRVEVDGSFAWKLKK